MKNPVIYSVYRLVFPDGKVYIGMTSRNPKRRWSGGYGYLTQKELDSAIKAFGWSEVEKHIDFVCNSKETAELKEIELIQWYQSNDRDTGYNIEKGGAWDSSIAIVRKNLSERRAGDNNPRYGKPCSVETKRKMSYAADSRKKKVFCLENGAVFESLKGAAEEVQVDPSNLRQACKNKNLTAGGLHWSFVAETEGGKLNAI